MPNRVGINVSEMEKRLRRIETLTVRCELCPRWSFTGNAEAALKAQTKHIREHGFKKRPRRRRDGIPRNGVVRVGSPR